MKKTSILRQFLVMIFTLITFAGFAQINANGGFESWTNGLPDGWKGNKSNITASNIVQVTDAHTGDYACMLKTVSSNKRFTTQPMSITANQQYTISYWVKGHGKIMSGITDGGTTYNYNDWREIDSPTFIQFVDTVSLDESVSNGEFIFGVKDLSSESGNDSLIIDDVEINFYPPVDENVVATPNILVSGTLVGTNYLNSATVTITTVTTGASIYYTTDGSVPTASSTEYTEPFNVTSSCTVNAIAMKEGFTDSEIATEEISIANVNVIFEEDFENQGLGQMTQYSVTGDTTIWATASYQNNYYANLNAYHQGVNEDWLMTPQLTPSADGLTLSFRTATKFNGPALQLKYSSDYTGSDDPNNATWTDITDMAEWSTGNYTWTPSGDVLIEETSPLYIAFVYTSTESQAAAWEVDDIIVTTSGTQEPTPSVAIISPANGATFSTLDTLNIDLDIQNFTLGTDGLLMIESELLTEAGLTSPYYLNAITWAYFQNMVFSPLPAGEFTATVALVGPDSVPVASATTTFSVVAPTLSVPTITVAGTETGTENTYYFTANVTIEAEEGAEIHYTTDGTTPDENAALYSEPFDVTTSCTVQAIAIKENYANSEIASAIIVIDTPTVAAPTFNPEGGIFTDGVEVSINCSDTDAVVYYTLDGNEPTTESELYSAPITLTETATIKAKAFKTGWHASEMVEATYTIVNEAILTVTPDTLTFNSENLTGDITISAAYIESPIVLTCSDTHFTLSQDTLENGNNTVTVTFDGTEPATGIITVTGDTLSAQVTLIATATLPAPTFTPESGATDTLIEVVIACENANATIYYTTDGTTPDAESNLYGEAIVLNTEGEHTINAIAILDGWDNSEVATATYTIVLPTPPTPPTPEYNDTLAYYTGFETSEGFTTSTVYNNINENLDGPANRQWGTVYGTVSTNSVINGESSMQMRWYTGQPENIGYTRTNFDISHATRIQFNAKANRDANVMVSYSTDSGNSYMDSIFTLTSNPQTYNWVISENAEYDNVRFKFTISLPDETPSGRVDLVIDSVCIYNFPSLVSQVVETPVISPNSGNVYDPVQVSISCATEGAFIHYTTNGEEPTENDNLYSNPFTVSSTATVKAKAFKAGFEPSNMASATYTFPIEVENIAAFKAANTATNNTVYKITGDVTFVFYGNDNYYIQDETGGLVIYDNNGVISGTYTEGDVISGGVYGTYTLYYGLVELKPTHDLAAATTNTGTVSPIISTIEGITTNYDQLESRLVKLEGVTFTNGGVFATGSANNMEITQNGEAMQVRSVFKNIDMEISAGATADVIGMVLRYVSNNSTNYQIAPRSNDDIVLSTVVMDTVATPVITVNPLTNHMVGVEITCATEDAIIHYTLDGTVPTASSTVYTNSFTHPDETFTIKAIAVKEGMANSLVASYTYTPVGINEHEINVSVYPNPTTGLFRIQNSESKIQSVEVYDVYGKLISNLEVNDNDVTIDVSNCTNGVYFTRIRTENGTVTKKVVKQ